MDSIMFSKGTLLPSYKCGLSHQKCKQNIVQLNHVMSSAKKLQNEAKVQSAIIQVLNDKFCSLKKDVVADYSNTLNNQYKKAHYYVNELTVMRSFDYHKHLASPLIKVRV